MAFMVFSCIEYTPIPTNEMVEVSFTHQMVSGKPMVRSGGSVLEDIASSTPTYLDLRLRNIELDTTFTCKSDESIRIPMGEYEIYGENVGRTNDNILYDVPPIKCDTFVTAIDESINSVSLDVYYDCYAVVALTNECKEIHLHTTGDKYITYGVFGGDCITRYFKTDVRLTLIPNEETDFLEYFYLGVDVHTKSGIRKNVSELQPSDEVIGVYAYDNQVISTKIFRERNYFNKTQNSIRKRNSNFQF